MFYSNRLVCANSTVSAQSLNTYFTQETELSGVFFSRVFFEIFIHFKGETVEKLWTFLNFLSNNNSNSPEKLSSIISGSLEDSRVFVSVEKNELKDKCHMLNSAEAHCIANICDALIKVRIFFIFLVAFLRWPNYLLTSLILKRSFMTNSQIILFTENWMFCSYLGICLERTPTRRDRSDVHLQKTDRSRLSKRQQQGYWGKKIEKVNFYSKKL